MKTVALYLRVSTGEQTVENQRRELLTRLSRPFAPLSIASAAACRISWRSSASSTAPVDLYLDRQGLDTTTPAGKALFQMLGVFAEFERSIIQERITAGIARARAKGTRSGRAFGRPKLSPEREAAVRTFLAAGTGIRKTARLVGTGNATVAQIAAEMRAA